MGLGSAGNLSTGEWRSRLGALKALGVLMLAMIAVHVVNALILGHAWDRYGILPAHADGLWPGVVSGSFSRRAARPGRGILPARSPVWATRGWSCFT